MDPEQARAAHGNETNEEPEAVTFPTVEHIEDQTESETDASDTDSDSANTQFLKSFLGENYEDRQRVGGSQAVIEPNEDAQSVVANLTRHHANDMGAMNDRVNALTDQIRILVGMMSAKPVAAAAVEVPVPVVVPKTTSQPKFPVAPLLERRLARGELTPAEEASYKANGAIRRHVQQDAEIRPDIEKSRGSNLSKTTVSGIPVEQPSALFGKLSGSSTVSQIKVVAEPTTVTLAEFKEAVKDAVPAYLASLKKREVKDSSTQTWVTQVYTFPHEGCGNCRRRGHNFKHCPLPKRPDVCHICGRDGTTTRDCLNPHGRDSSFARGRCPGCGVRVELYNPTCDECDKRLPGHGDWLRGAHPSANDKPSQMGNL